MGCGNGFRVSKNAQPSQRTEFKNAYQKSYYAAVFTDGPKMTNSTFIYQIYTKIA